MAGRLNDPAPLRVDAVRAYLEETIAGMVAAASQLPLAPAYLPHFAQIGQNILALEAILKHLP